MLRFNLGGSGLDLTSEDLQARRIHGDRMISVSDPIPWWYGPECFSGLLHMQRHTYIAPMQNRRCPM